ncbi:MAG: DUF1465 family protein [Pseudomonadota bacterium]
MINDELRVVSAETASKNVGPFVASKVFNSLFASGMELVEETALYLDEDGKNAARTLPRREALNYASVSMRLTTRLMQIASWLLVLRAVRDDEMSKEEASQDKYRIGQPDSLHLAAEAAAGLPERMLSLITETDTLYARVVRIDRELFVDEPTQTFGDDAAGQLAALRSAFPG